MKKSILALLLISTLFSCKKDEPKQFSTWYVNGQKFTTNDVRYDKGKARNEISSNNQTDRFDIYFNLGELPITGNFLINCSQQNPHWCCMAIIYQGKGYVEPKNAFIYASFYNGKARYTLDETWFYNELDNNDSILVKGTFNEP